MKSVVIVAACTGMALAVVAGGCASGGSSKAHAAPAATAQSEAVFNRVKALAGSWEMDDEKGQNKVAVVYRVVAGGSAVCELMFPGSEHEMVNMYHMDGNRVLVTHYCAAGNQPRMAAMDFSTPQRIVFSPESVTNLKSDSTEYMGSLELEMPDADHLVQHWNSQKAGAPTENAVFAMTRRK